MNQQDITKYARRLHSWFSPLCRSACRKLAANPSASVVPHLAEALYSDDPKVRSTASTALHALTDAGAVDVLCALWVEGLWVEGRDKHLGHIIAERQYVARQPVEVRVLSALQANRLEVAGENAAAIQSLVAACKDQDSTIAQRANTALRTLTDAGAVDALCELVIADPTGPAAAIVKEMDYQPQSISRRCVLFLLTGQLERYFDLDFEFQHLRAEYQAGDEGLRQRIGAVVRQSGDAKLIGLFRRRKLASELTEHEAAIVIDVYTRNQQWPEIFTLLFQIPLSSAVVALDVLGKSEWQPQNDIEASLLDELLTIRSSIGDIPEKPPAPDVTLGPVLARWIEHGCRLEFLKRSTGNLRKILYQAHPPDAVAALAALAASNTITAGDIEAARTHKHWLVRLACLALCDIALQFAFSDMPISGDGGGMWINRLAPAVLDAVVYRRRAISLNPDQVSALQTALGSEKNQKGGRWACGRLLEALARHHLRHTIEVDEQMTVEIGETAIEIEG